jgi:hypothetical protein
MTSEVRMGILRSRLGWALVVIYVVAFVTVFSRVHAHEPWGLVPAVIFCSMVVLLLGGRTGARGAGAPSGQAASAAVQVTKTMRIR